jgi:hypothetical protein
VHQASVRQPFVSRGIAGRQRHRAQQPQNTATPTTAASTKTTATATTHRTQKKQNNRVTNQEVSHQRKYAGQKI